MFFSKKGKEKEALFNEGMVPKNELMIEVNQLIFLNFKRLGWCAVYATNSDLAGDGKIVTLTVYLGKELYQREGGGIRFYLGRIISIRNITM